MTELSPPQRRAIAVLFLLVTIVAALVAGGHTYAIDNEVQLQTTRSLVHLKPELDSIDQGWAARDDGPYRDAPSGHGKVAIVGIGYSIIAAPFYIAARVGAEAVPEGQRDGFIRVGTFFTNSVILGLLAVMVALFALELGAGFVPSLLTGAAYALGTYALPHSKTFFTELASALALMIAVWAVVRFRRTGTIRLVTIAGFATGFGVLIRASGALFVPFLLIWLVAASIARERGVRPQVRALAWFGAGGAPTLVAFLFFNWWRFGSATDIGYPRIPQSNPLLDGLDGLFLSPGKSIFLYAPLAVLGIVGLVVGIRRQWFAVSLCGAIAVANIVFFSRVPYWAGDAAWGPRYQQAIVPLLCAPAVLVWRWAPFRSLFAIAAGSGVVLSMLGSLLYFNVLFMRADIAGVGSSAMTYDITWEPFLGMLEYTPAAIRDVFDENRPDEIDRGPFWGDPSTHYAYYSSEPRLDFWYLWVRPTGASRMTYLYFVPIIGAWLVAVRLCRPTAESASTLLGVDAARERWRRRRSSAGDMPVSAA